MQELREYRDILLQAYAQVAANLANMLGSISDTASHKSPLLGAWTVHRLVAHLRDVEACLFQPGIEQALVTGGADQPCFLEDSWEKQGYQVDEPLEAILAAYLQRHNQALARLRSLPDAAWNRTCRHPTWGPRTLQWWVEQSHASARAHLLQIQQALGVREGIPQFSTHPHDGRLR
jgi:hypothetical protein